MRRFDGEAVAPGAASGSIGVPGGVDNGISLEWVDGGIAPTVYIMEKSKSWRTIEYSAFIA